jgi:molybdopterin converting factor small subunit
VNVVIVYPPGNTTVPVALEQGPRLAQEGINLILTPFPTVGTQPKSKKKLLYLNDGFMYLGKDDYQRALRATGVTHRVNQNQEGTLVAIKFTHPVIAHGIFFHFTHPLRCTIDSLNIPLIQPLVWEAATHLKCRLPAMLKGSGVKTPEQINWYQKQTLKLGERETKAEIKKKVLAFSKKYSPLIVKPEKESGGRGAKILPVRSNGKINIENVTKLTELIYEISKGDNVVIQEVLPCEVRRLYTREFLEEMVARFAKIGIPVLLEREPKTPLFSYFRQILIRGKRNYQISHHITVISTQGIANVGQGGLLFEYRDEIINPKYREALRQEITKASFNSLTAQRKYIQKHGSEILNEYLAIHPEFEGKLKLRGNKKVLPKFSFDIPYEMGDYMPVFLVDENDNLIRVYDEEKEKIIPLFDDTGKPQEKVKIYDKNGKPIPRVTKHGTPLPIPMFDKDGKPIPRYLKKGKSLVSITPLVIFKIEANPGAGLWRPHNDQLPPERKGEGVFTIFKCLGERAAIYQRKLNKFLPEKDKLSPEAQGNKTIYLSSQLKRNQSSESFQIIDEAVKKAKEELGG